MNHNSPANAFPNARRVATARSALCAAMWSRRDNPAFCDEAVIDLLADLRHFCFARQIDFAECNAAAQAHFEAETTGGRQ